MNFNGIICRGCQGHKWNTRLDEEDDSCLILVCEFCGTESRINFSGHWVKVARARYFMLKLACGIFLGWCVLIGIWIYRWSGG